jgi:2-polyprenyl-3-methyl-5-hydroxy-6-metoxy-1,4-benzoquinol methylase
MNTDQIIENSVDQVLNDYIFRDSTGDLKKPKLLDIAKLVTKHVPVGGKILDFGSGFGDVPAVLSILGYKCTAIDDFSDPWHTEENIQRTMKFSEKYNINRVSDIVSAGSGFDMVMLHDVLEHLHDSPRDILHDLLSSTKDSGLLYATVPNAVNIRKRITVLLGGTNLPHYNEYYWHPHPFRGHVREYVRGDFEKMAHWLDLEVIQLEALNKMLPKLKSPIRQIWQLASILLSDCRDTWQFLGKKTLDWSPILEPANETLKNHVKQNDRAEQDMQS